MGEEPENRTYKMPTAFVVTVFLVFFIGLVVGIILVKDKSVTDVNDLKIRMSVIEEKVGTLEDHDIEMQKLKQALFTDVLTGS